MGKSVDWAAEEERAARLGLLRAAMLARRDHHRKLAAAAQDAANGYRADLALLKQRLKQRRRYLERKAARAAEEAGECPR